MFYWKCLLIHSFFVYSWFMQRNFQLAWLCTVEWWDDKWMINWCPGSDRVNVPAYDGLEEMDRSTKTLSHDGRFVGLETSWIPVRSQASPYGTCDKQMSLGQVFLLVLWFSPVSTIQPMVHTHLHLHVTLSRRPKGRSHGNFQIPVFFRKSISICYISTFTLPWS